MVGSVTFSALSEASKACAGRADGGGELLVVSTCTVTLETPPSPAPHSSTVSFPQVGCEAQSRTGSLAAATWLAERAGGWWLSKRTGHRAPRG